MAKGHECIDGMGSAGRERHGDERKHAAEYIITEGIKMVRTEPEYGQALVDTHLEGSEASRRQLARGENKFKRGGFLWTGIIMKGKGKCNNEWYFMLYKEPIEKLEEIGEWVSATLALNDSGHIAPTSASAEYVHMFRTDNHPDNVHLLNKPETQRYAAQFFELFRTCTKPR